MVAFMLTKNQKCDIMCDKRIFKWKGVFSMDLNARTRSWHCTMKHPVDYDIIGDTQSIIKGVIQKWCNSHKRNISAVTWCKLPDNTYQFRMVFQSDRVMRISVLQKKFKKLFETVEAGSRHDSIDFLIPRDGTKILAYGKCGTFSHKFMGDEVFYKTGAECYYEWL